MRNLKVKEQTNHLIMTFPILECFWAKQKVFFCNNTVKPEIEGRVAIAGMGGKILKN